MSDPFDEFERKTSGKWLSSKNTEDGETFNIERFYVDDESYEDRTYFVCEVVADATTKFRNKGDECNARLGIENYERVKKKLGKSWVGNKLRIVEHDHYFKGLGKYGVIYEGVQLARQEKIEPSPSPFKRVQPQAEARQPLEVSSQVVQWLTYNKNLIGEAVPPDIYNITPKEILEELSNTGLLYPKDDYPYLHKDALELVK